MKRIIVSIICLFAMVTSYPQTAESEQVFTKVEKMPEYPGGILAMQLYLQTNIKYPQAANGAEGRILIQFVIDTDGSVTDAMVVKSVNPHLDAEALRVINAMPKWKPGTQKGKAVRVKYTIPINFRHGTTTGMVEQKENNVKPSSVSAENKPNVDFMANWVKQRSWGTDAFLESPSVKTVYINKYNTDYQFADGMLAIQNAETGKWGFIDEDGNLLKGGYKWSYVDYKTPRFGSGHCLVALKNEANPRKLDWYILDKKGNAKRFSPSGEIYSVSSFNEDGIVSVVVQSSLRGYLTYFNTEGVEVYEKLSSSITLGYEIKPLGVFKDDRALFHNPSKNEYGFIDRNGNIIGNKTFLRAQEFSEGLAAVEVNTDLGRRWGYIDVNGNMVIQAKFSKEPSPFSCGYAVAEKQNRKDVFINKKGEVCGNEYGNLTNFVNGYALASISTKCYIIDTNMNVQETKGVDHYVISDIRKILPVETTFDGKYIIFKGSSLGFSSGLIWPQTCKLYPIGYGPFGDNRVHVRVDTGVHQDDQHYFLDRSGQIVIKFAKEEF